LLAQLRRNLFYEVCLGLTVVAIVGWLGITPPARSETTLEGIFLRVHAGRLIEMTQTSS
jgi:hypothetical protein